MCYKFLNLFCCKSNSNTKCCTLEFDNLDRLKGRLRPIVVKLFEYFKVFYRGIKVGREVSNGGKNAEKEIKIERKKKKERKRVIEN